MKSLPPDGHCLLPPRLEPDAGQPQDLVVLEPHREIKRLGHLGGVRDVLRQQAPGGSG